MNLLPLAILWWLSKQGGAPAWPSQSSPPPQRPPPVPPVPPVPPPPPEPATTAPDIPKPPEAVAPSSRTAIPVLQAQKISNALGARLRRDGLYGPQTVNAWRAAAQKYGFDPVIVRLGPKTVAVDVRTLSELRSLAGSRANGPALRIP